jgi:hypothetical protein
MSVLLVMQIKTSCYCFFLWNLGIKNLKTLKKSLLSYSFSTSALDRGEWSASRPGRALAPGKGPPVPIVQEAGWAPEPVWTQSIEEKSFTPAGDRTPIARSSSQSDTILPELTRLLIPRYEADKIKEDEVGVACGTHGTEQKSVQSFGGKE